MSQSRGHITQSSIPRWLVPLLLLPGALMAHALLPTYIATLAPRMGWSKGRPRRWHWLAVIPLGIGIAGVIWGAIVHFAHAPQSVKITDRAQYLVQKGPYRFTRNPLYLSEVLMWLGWAWFYGSLPVLIGAAACWLIFNTLVIPSEERALEARFGESYRRYMESIPRWL